MDAYKMDLAESLAREYSTLGEDDSAQKKLLKRKLWAMLERDVHGHNTPQEKIHSKNMIFAYIRTNAKEQNINRQIQAVIDYAEVKNITVDRIIEENTILGEIYQSMKLMLQRGDTLIVKELCCLGYNTAKVGEAWRELGQKGVDIIIIDNEQLSTANKTESEKSLIHKIVFEMLSYMIAKENEKIQTYKKTEIVHSIYFMDIYKCWKQGELTVKEALVKLNMSQTTFYRRVKMYEKIFNK